MGYLELLTGNKGLPTDSEQPASTATAEQISKFNILRQANKQGFIDLMLSVDETTKPPRMGVLHSQVLRVVEMAI
jgi:hypothetical protein